MIKGLIFDFDGLMLDTETPEFNAIRDAYAHFGHSLEIEMYGRVVGSEYGQAFEPIAHLQTLTGAPVDAERFWDLVNRRRFEIIDSSPLLPGVEACVRDAKQHGLKLAVASSSPHRWVDGYLRRFGLFQEFDAVCCKEDVSKVKPDPELFLAALNALQLEPHEALVFEDSPNGVRAAQRAGIRVVLVPNPVTAALKFEGESLRLESLAQMPLLSLLDYFEAK